MFTTKLIWAASFHCAVISSADIPGKKIDWDPANHCFPLLVTLTTSNTCSHGEREREFVVNRCWSKPKCHTDTDFRAPSGQVVLSQARSCIHKLTLELATAGEGRWRAQFSLGWFEVAHPLPALLSTLFWRESSSLSSLGGDAEAGGVSCQHTPAFLDEGGLLLLGKKRGGISSFRLNLSLKCYLLRVRTSLF